MIEEILPLDATEEEKACHAKRCEAIAKYEVAASEAEAKYELLVPGIEAANLSKYADEYERDQANRSDKYKAQLRCHRKAIAIGQEVYRMPTVSDMRKMAVKKAKVDAEAERQAWRRSEWDSICELVSSHRSESLNRFGHNVRDIAEIVSEGRRHDSDKRPGVVLHPTLRRLDDESGIIYEQLFVIRPIKWNRLHGFDMTSFSISGGKDFKADMLILPDGEVRLRAKSAVLRTARPNFASLLLLIEQNADLNQFIGIAGGRCLVCGHHLKVEESRGRSVGPECWKGIGEKLMFARRDQDSLKQAFQNSPEVTP